MPGFGRERCQGTVGYYDRAAGPRLPRQLDRNKEGFTGSHDKSLRIDPHRFAQRIDRCGLYDYGLRENATAQDR
ncbi:MAG: hypothetical protein AMXMBFR4_26390 [Candidatus Hydrogenedentota bacterium]